jgi:hypothetical protein
LRTLIDVRAAGIDHVPVDAGGGGGVTRFHTGIPEMEIAMWTREELDEAAEQTGGAPRATPYREVYEQRATRGAGS